MRLCPGDYGHFKEDPMKGETFQRQQCLAEAADADWVLQIDTDEVLPNPERFLEMLEYAAERNISAVEWPMRVFFQRLKDGRFLEVCESKKNGHYEYPGPIAVRPHVKLACARRTDGQFLRAVVVGDKRSLQVRRRPEPNEFRVDCCKETDAILHFSWVRTPAEIRSKIASWGHNEGWKSWLFYHVYWKSAPTLWRWLRDFHPFARGLWPALRPVRDQMALVDGI
jgi:glycosyltransferase involved in cell wall biosynthesis